MHLQDFEQASLNVSIFKTKFKSQLEIEIYQLNKEIADLEINLTRLLDIVKKNVIVSNISGVGYNSEGIQTGSFLQKGQKVAEIIPNLDLEVVCYVSPKDIAFIELNQKVNIQVDAYNYFDWGTINGFVSQIKKDVVLVNNRPTYIVHCTTGQNYLTSKSGAKGEVIKGMTCRVNFFLTKASLWQIIFTKTNEWLNPKANKLEIE